jgi:Ca2+-binding RTX toxin-like protein
LYRVPDDALRVIAGGREMATYSFETITAAQALAITAADTIVFGSGTANEATVIYQPNGQISIFTHGLSVDFAGTLAGLSQAEGLHFPQGSVLYIGDALPNAFQMQAAIDGSAMFGGGGDDNLVTRGDHALMQGNAGNDSLAAVGASATIYGGQGDDAISAGLGGNFLQGNKGNDVIRGSVVGIGGDTLLGGQGDDFLDAGAGASFLNGNLGNDTISMSGNGDQAFGEDGNDKLTSAGLDPAAVHAMHGGPGNDTLTAGSVGLSTMWGDDGNDSMTSISGRAGAMDGGDGNDTIVGSTGADTMTGDAGNDAINDFGGVGNVIDGGDGNDTLTASGNSGATGTILGGAGDDVISTLQASHYEIDAGDGNDNIRGSGGNDTITAGAGNDTIDDSGGADVISGGAGADQFFFLNGTSSDPAALTRILDWSSGDSLHFRPPSPVASGFTTASAPDFATALTNAANLIQTGHFAYVATQVGADVIVFAGPSATPDAVELVGRTLADIRAQDIFGGN